MNKSSAQKFLQGLDICKSLVDYKYQPTNLTFQAIELFCELSPTELRRFTEEYAAAVGAAYNAVYEYATTADNWRVDCQMGFGVKDHCSILSFLLNGDRRQFESFTGNFTTPEVICELIQDWKGIDITELLA
ncbi:MAG: hypothetical protein EBE86_006550 [Hormoscilla sp. GUM202]|nr:hypothetical protein [Hormoscilla sp. GUM202]